MRITHQALFVIIGQDGNNIDSRYANSQQFEVIVQSFPTALHDEVLDTLFFSNLPDAFNHLACLADGFPFHQEAGIGASITKNLELSVVIQDNYVNLPAPGRKSNDVKIVSGVTYKF